MKEIVEDGSLFIA